MQYEVLNINDPEQMRNIDSISKKLAEIVTSPWNDQATVLINGPRGSGKSLTGLSIATRTAQYISEIKGGNTSQYFTLKNVAIIKLDRVLNVLDDLHQYGIYFLDDIGVGYSSREWRSDKNIRMNKVIQTFRTDNVITILSVPDKGLLDKVPRELIDKYIETNKDGNMYAYGLNLVKIFNIERLLRDDKQLEILPVVEQKNQLHQYAKYVVRRPPDSLVMEYEQMRKDIAQELRKEETEAIREGEIDEPTTQRNTKKDAILEHYRTWQQGYKDKSTWTDYIKNKGFNSDYSNNVVIRARKEGIISKSTNTHIT